MRTHTNDGLTLIEILLAIGVLLVGIAGILPLFYAGLSKTKQSVELSNATIIASSVSESITQSMRLDQFDRNEQTKGENWVRYWHAGAPIELYFQLPGTGQALGYLNQQAGVKGTLVEIPKDARTKPLGAGTAVGFDVFSMGGAETAGFPLNVQATNRDKDQLSTYQFNFLVRPTSNPHQPDLYEFVIRVYRNYRASDPAGNQNRLILELPMSVAGK